MGNERYDWPMIDRVLRAHYWTRGPKWILGRFGGSWHPCPGWEVLRHRAGRLGLRHVNVMSLPAVVRMIEIHYPHLGGAGMVEQIFAHTSPAPHQTAICSKAKALGVTMTDAARAESNRRRGRHARARSRESDPTPREIRARAAMVRASWTDDRYRQACGSEEAVA